MMTGALAVEATAAAGQTYTVPPRPLPVPPTASPELRALIAGPLNPGWSQQPASAEAWRTLVRTFAADVELVLPALIAREKVKVRADRIGGVPVFWIEPDVLPPENRDRILLNFHGGAYVFAPGRSGLRDAILLAGRGFRVVSVDYRMAPDAPYPAAIDDAETVWKALVARHPAKRIGVFGSSTGGAMTLALVVRAKAHHLPLPGALWAGTPWAQLDKVGDSYFSNDHVDNALVSYDGLLGAAARLYANGHDMADPELSPVNADLSGFPPTLLTTGTRDLFLSNTIRVHRKLKQAGVLADLNVYEGLSHGDFERDPDLPESREVYGEAAAFFRHALAR
ncbi:acetyl esterase/lipase [Sphingomonas vulcanisoli]|uniref:Acetyl esterase/lipase n=1 Tax=Sphingomonas vulcanisoli TaxID=1658060 RepID=A0ABX0U0P5_9SPHN|nr:alpha/beta hydrolase [Sphingomonas vulcanisoli]NIJ09565.1 acetyl esterase/lipase [Sphingomonas vulcanisoli]